MRTKGYNNLYICMLRYLMQQTNILYTPINTATVKLRCSDTTTYILLYPDWISNLYVMILLIQQPITLFCTNKTYSYNPIDTATPKLLYHRYNSQPNYHTISDATNFTIWLLVQQQIDHYTLIAKICSMLWYSWHNELLYLYIPMIQQP